MSDIRDPRVLFAAERTLLAWNRTSVALIAFGFLVERSGLLIQVLTPEETISVAMRLTVVTGLAFILLGSFTSLYSARQYLGVLKTLAPAEFPHGYNARWGVIVSGLMALLGLVLLVVLFLSQ